MSQKSKIEWTESSWNPITGCTKISSGCANCYAATFAKRLKAMGNPRYINGFNITIHEDLFERPLQWKKPQMIFVNSMSDLFHEDIPFEVIKSIFVTMNKANWHTFQILTKRAERLVKLAPDLNWTPNIWMGVSIEDKAALERCRLLKQTPAQVKFISAEPLIENINIIELDGIDWLIVGGESGHGSRPIEKDWILELKDKSHESGTAFFFKQWGGTNKAKSGSMLDGKEYKAYPTLLE
jgi:protein gp37